VNNCVSRIFAAATLLQLYLVDPFKTTGHSNPNVQEAVDRVILEIEMHPEVPSARRIAWPICIAGCVADQAHRSFFEDLLLNVLQEADGSMSNCETVLNIMRTCWRYQLDEPDLQWDCGRTMERMGIRALLI